MLARAGTRGGAGWGVAAQEDRFHSVTSVHHLLISTVSPAKTDRHWVLGTSAAAVAHSPSSVVALGWGTLQGPAAGPGDTQGPWWSRVCVPGPETGQRRQ